MSLCKKRIVLIRHAKTPGNKEGRYIGKTDEDISEEGKEDAAALSCKFAKEVKDYGHIEKPYKVFSGPLKRCKNTAKLLFPDADPVIIPELFETDFGVFEGKCYEELKDDSRYIKWIESGGTVPAPEGECRDELIKRSMEGFYEAVRQTEDTAFIVCCGGNIMAVMSFLTGGNFYDFQAGNLEGYTVDLITDGKILSDITFERFSSGGTG